MNEEMIKQIMTQRESLGPDIYYTLKDDEAIRPLAGLWKSDGYGREDAEARAKKTGLTVTAIKIVEFVL